MSDPRHPPSNVSLCKCSKEWENGVYWGKISLLSKRITESHTRYINALKIPIWKQKRRQIAQIPPPLLQSLLYKYICKSGGWKITLKSPFERQKEGNSHPLFCVINAHGFGNMFRKKEMGFCASSLERPCVKSERMVFIEAKSVSETQPQSTPIFLNLTNLTSEMDSGIPGTPGIFII